MKKALKERGLPMAGTKSELLERLKSAIQSEEGNDWPFINIRPEFFYLFV